MNTKSAVEFINSIVRNLQVLCHSNVEFSEDVEVIGHIYLSVDKAKKYNYILNEKVCKSDNSSTVFMSNSFHAEHNGEKNDTDGNRQNKTNNKAFNSSSATNEKHQLPSNKHPSLLQKRFHNSLSGSATASDRNIFHQDIHQQKSHNLQRENLHYKDEEPIKKVRKLGETSSSVLSVKKESFTAEPVFFQSQLSSIQKDFNDIERQTYSSGASETSTSNRQTMSDSCEHNEFDTPSLHVDLTNIKEEPVDLFSENRLGMNHILNTEMQSNQFEETHASAMENLQNLSSTVTTYSDMSISPTAQQQQQILSLFASKRRAYRSLSLEERVKLIKESENNSKLSQSKLAEMFGTSQMTVSNILKWKNKFLKLLSVRKRNDLTLLDKIRLIDEAEAQPHLSQRALSQKCKVSQSTVCTVLKRKAELKAEYEKQQT